MSKKRIEQLLQQIETYGFVSEAGPLEKSRRWQELKDQMLAQQDELTTLSETLDHIHQLATAFIHKENPING